MYIFATKLSGSSARFCARYPRYLFPFCKRFSSLRCNNRGRILDKQFVKSPKQYLVDIGLLSFLLGFDTQRILQHPTISGAILENFVQSELSKQISWSTQRVMQYHYRTYNGIKVDIILENAAGTLVGIEIKNSQTVSSSDIKGLVDLQESMGTNFHRGFILYTGSEVIPFGKNIFAIPVWYLWKKGLA